MNMQTESSHSTPTTPAQAGTIAGITVGGANRFGYWIPTTAQHSAINGLGAEFNKLMTYVEKTIPHGNVVFAAEVIGCLENAFLLAVQGITKPVGN